MSREQHFVTAESASFPFLSSPACNVTTSWKNRLKPGKAGLMNSWMEELIGCSVLALCTRIFGECTGWQGSITMLGAMLSPLCILELCRSRNLCLGSRSCQAFSHFQVNLPVYSSISSAQLPLGEGLFVRECSDRKRGGGFKPKKGIF